MCEFHDLANALTRSRRHSDDNLFDLEICFALQNSFRFSDYRNSVHAGVASAIIVKKCYWLEFERWLVHHMPHQLCPSLSGADNTHPARFILFPFPGPGSERPHISKAESDHCESHNAENEINENDPTRWSG